MELSKEAYVTTSEQPESPPPVYHKPALWDRFLGVLDRFWIVEIFSCLVSLTMLAAVLVLLKHYNHDFVDLWEHSWSLNSLVGFLATISEITMAVPLASCISQLKWTWYKQNQKLTDLDKFDQGSRGALGSVLLLLSRPFKFLGAIGAILTILSLAFHTLTQQAISTRSGNFMLDDFYGDPVVGASYPQGNNYSWALDYSTGDTFGDQGPRMDMIADINYGMYYAQRNLDTRVLQPIANCSFGNCTWDRIQTLGVCSKCADITDQIITDPTNDAWFTTKLYKIFMRKDVGLVESWGNTFYPDSSILPGIGPLITHWIALARGSAKLDPIGMDCALYWCIIDETDVIMTDYSITYEVWNSTSDFSEAGKTFYGQQTDITLTPDPGTCLDAKGRKLDPTECTKTVGYYAQHALQNFFTSPVLGFTGTATHNSTYNGWNINNLFVQLLYTTMAQSDNLTLDYSIIMENIAYVMTDNIRQAGHQAGVSKSFGNTSVWATVYHIRWGFLVIPTVLVLLSIVFLLITIIKSWGQEKWKASLLPLLFHPLHDGHKPGVAPHRIAELKTIADHKEVRLERTHLGSQFV